MSCYIRHLKDLLSEAGIEVTAENRKQIDRAIHEIVNTTYKDCPGTWKEVKKKPASSEAEKREFVKKIKAALA
jgi:molecular chaperone GrpE (heat shock protein)